MEEYTPFGHTDWQGIVARVKRFAGEGKKTAIVSTINGDANVPFYRELGNQGIKAEDIPCVAFSRRRGGAGRHRHQAAGRPPGGVELLHVRCPGTPNDEFKAMWQAYIKNPTAA